MLPSRRRLLFLAIGAALLLAAWLVLPRLRMAKVDFVPHGDPQRAAVAGRVQDAQGKPIGGVQVTWFVQQGDASLLGFRTFRGGDLQAITGADGAFRFDSVPLAEGRAALDTASGYEGESGHVLPQAGHAAEGLRIAAEPIGEDRWLRGRLLHRDGTPAAGVVVQVKVERLLRSWQGIARTDAEGRFDAMGPWAGVAVELLLLPDEGAPKPLGTHRFGEPVQVTLPD